MKVFILIDWNNEHIIGVYSKIEEAESDYKRLRLGSGCEIIKRDLINE